jgi:hypothetical protein
MIYGKINRQEQLATGRRIKTLTVVDDCTKEEVQLVRLGVGLL